MSSGPCVPLSTFLVPESWRARAIWVGETLERQELLGATAGPPEARCLWQLHACSGLQIVCPAENGAEDQQTQLFLSAIFGPLLGAVGRIWAPQGQSTSCPLHGQTLRGKKDKAAGEDGGQE